MTFRPRLRSKPKRKLQTTKAYREERTAKCMAYIREAGDIPMARRLANEREGWGAQTSAWLTALGRLLGEGWQGKEHQRQQEQP